MPQTDAPDAIDAAIEKTTQTVEMIQVQIPLAPNGRPLILAVPRDVTADEMLSALVLVPSALVQMRGQNPASRIVLPSGRPA